MVSQPTGPQPVMNQHSTTVPFGGGGAMKRKDSPNVDQTPTTEVKRVRFAEVERGSTDTQIAASMFKQFINNALNERSTGDTKLYHELRRKFTIDPSDEEAPSSLELRQTICALTQNVSKLDRSCSTLVADILQTVWAGRDNLFFKAYMRFLGNLVSAHGNYIPMVTTMLVEYLALKSSSICTLPNHQPVTRQTIYNRTHEALQYIMELVPTAAYSTLYPALVKEFPNKGEKKLAHTTYLSNLLRVIDYVPSFRSKIMAMVMEKVIKIDIEIQADIEDLEDESGEFLAQEMNKAGEGEEPDVESEASSETLEDYDGAELNSITRIKETVDKLDAMLEILFEHYAGFFPTKPAARVGAETQTAFDNLLESFDSTVLPTYQSRYTQFVMFWAVQKSPQFMDIFLGELIGCATDSNKSQVMRQAAAAYVASFVARAKMMDRGSVRTVVSVLCNWLNSYLVRREADCGGPDLQKYGSFYSVFQAVLYIFCFRWKDLKIVDDGESSTAQTARWLPALLVIQRAIVSRFNPLKVCSPGVVNEFARISNFLNFVYCYSILEKNKRGFITSGNSDNYETHGEIRMRSALEAYFPFDPYKLRRSRKWVEEYYVEWEAIPGLHDDDDDDDDQEEEEEEEDENEDDGNEEDELTEVDDHEDGSDDDEE